MELVVGRILVQRLHALRERVPRAAHEPRNHVDGRSLGSSDQRRRVGSADEELEELDVARASKGLQEASVRGVAILFERREHRIRTRLLLVGELRDPTTKALEQDVTVPHVSEDGGQPAELVAHCRREVRLDECAKRP